MSGRVPSGRARRALERLAGVQTVAITVGAVVILVGAGLAIVGLRGGDSLAAGEARLRPEGEVEVSLAGAEFTAATSEMVLTRGDRVRVASGSAVLELPGGSRSELRDGSTVAIGGDDDAALRLERGELLVEVARNTTVVDGGSAMVTVGAGASRLRRTASLVGGVYEGSLLVAGTGQSLSVPSLRQVSVVGAGRIPDAVAPLDIDEDDEWDRRFLGEVLELDRRLVAFGIGFEPQLADDVAVTPSFFRTLLPPLDDAPLTEEMLEGRSAGENLIGLAIVALVDGAFDDVFEAVFGLRQQGARWGLIAADQGLDDGQVVETVEVAIDRAPLDLVTAAPAPFDGEPGSSPSPGPSGPTTPTTTVGGPPPTEPGGPGPSTSTSSTTTTTGLVPLPPPGGSSTTTTTAPPDDCGVSLVGGLICA